MTESKLKDLIFARDSTTLKTLSDLEVTDISSLVLDITKLQKEAIEFKQQLDSLGRNLSLEVDKLSNRINDNTTLISQTDQSVIKNYSEFTSFKNSVNQQLEDINKKLENVDETIRDDVNVLQGEISRVKDFINSQIVDQLDQVQRSVMTINMKLPQLEDSINKLLDSVYNFPSPLIRGMGIIDKDTVYESTCQSIPGNDRSVLWYVPVTVPDRTLKWNTEYDVKFQDRSGNPQWLDGKIYIYSDGNKLRAGPNQDFMGIPNLYYLTINGSGYDLTSYNVTKAITNL